MNLPDRIPRPSLSFVLLLILLGSLWLGGGASRADASGQLLVRGVAWGLIVIWILAAPTCKVPLRSPVVRFFLCACALAVLQILPLPPAVWQTLPGRSIVSQAAALSGQLQPWRAWSIVPGATLNALSSLVVPGAILLFAATARDEERRLLPSVMLALVTAMMMIGLLQFSGAGFSNPLVNDTLGEVSGTFANRNHFALFVAMGCALVPGWALRSTRRLSWRLPAGFALLVLFLLTLIASGSRAGLGLGGLALALGVLSVRQTVARHLARSPRWVVPAFVAAGLAMVAAVVGLSVAADRAVAIDRLVAIDPAADMRQRSLGTLLAMMAHYFPVGGGIGAFDPLFRIHEPFALLKPTYFNHAHDDWLEVVIEAGLPGALLLAAATIWWAWSSVVAWRAGTNPELLLRRLGSAWLLLVFVASLFDYPARTPMIMAAVVLAAIWLSAETRGASALPDHG